MFARENRANTLGFMLSQCGALILEDDGVPFTFSLNRLSFYFQALSKQPAIKKRQFNEQIG